MLKGRIFSLPLLTIYFNFFRKMRSEQAIFIVSGVPVKMFANENKAANRVLSWNNVWFDFLYIFRIFFHVQYIQILPNRALGSAL